MTKLRINAVFQCGIGSKPLLRHEGPAVTGRTGNDDLRQAGGVGDTQVPRGQCNGQKFIRLARGGSDAEVPVFDLRELETQLAEYKLALKIIELGRCMQ